MTQEWKELKTLQEVAAAIDAGEEIQIDFGEGYQEWNGLYWQCIYHFLSRPRKQIKTIALNAWYDGDQLFWLRSGVEPKWPSKRVPAEDKEIEVEV